MKKTLSTILSLIIALSIMFTFAGCGSDDDNKKDDKKGTSTSETGNKKEQVKLSDEEVFIGEWVCEIDMSDFINDMLAEEGEMAEYINIDDFVINMNFKFTDDTLKIALDKDSLKDSFKDVMKDMKKGVERYLEDMLEESGVDMTLDELLATQGVTLDELIEEQFDDDMLDDMIEETFGKANATSKYKIEDGKLYSEDDGKFEADEYLTYKIVNNDKIKITGTSKEMDDDDQMFLSLLPFVLERK